jgi:hypothetical protein
VTPLAFEVVGAAAERQSAAPALRFTIGVRAADAAPIDALALNVQIRVEPQWRRYDPVAAERLHELFGPPSEWGRTLRSLVWTQATALVPAFTEAARFDVLVPVTYDLEVAAARYADALDDGELPLRFVFNGTIFRHAASGFSGTMVPWDCEATTRLPVATWRAALAAHFGDTAWLRIDRATLALLERERGRAGAASWDALLRGWLENEAPA